MIVLVSSIPALTVLRCAVLTGCTGTENIRGPFPANAEGLQKCGKAIRICLSKSSAEGLRACYFYRFGQGVNFSRPEYD